MAGIWDASAAYSIEVSGDKEVAKALKRYGKLAVRALSAALNSVAYHTMQATRQDMRKVFDRPVDYTIHGTRYSKATPSDLEAVVALVRPYNMYRSKRMSRHYLEPMVYGGPRKLKGFERALGLGELVPTRYMDLDAHGNVSGGVIRQILSVLGEAEGAAGYSANKTARSARRNTKERDYVLITSRQHGRLSPGVYKRVPKGGAALTHKERLRHNDRSRAYQKGRSRDVLARGLMPLFLPRRAQGKPYTPRLDFLGVARRTNAQRLLPEFRRKLAMILANPWG